MQRMMDGSMLQSLRLVSPFSVSPGARPVSSVPPRPPARSTGTLLESCRLADHKLEELLRVHGERLLLTRGPLHPGVQDCLEAFGRCAS